MRTKTQPTVENDRRAYRGYLLQRSPFDGLWRVSKGGFVVTTQETLIECQDGIDAILGEPEGGRS
jgi:hypothetical protein